MTNVTTPAKTHVPPEMLPITWDFGLVVVSYFLSVMSSYSALRILQMRFSHAMVVLASACLSCSGIFCMHFIGMAAYEIPTHVEYNIGWTVFSLLVAFTCTTAALLLLNVKLRRVELERGDDALEDENSVEGNVAALLHAPHLHIILSATIIALGVCAMHYTGMHSIVSDAKPRMRWGVIVASVLIALFAATAALYFAFILPVTKHFAILTAMVMGVAVCGMHYTGMHGMVYELDPALRTESTTQLTEVVPYIIFLSCALSSLAIAVSSHQYRLKLQEAVLGAQELALDIANAEFKERSEAEVAAEREKYSGFREVLALKEAFVTMQKELTRLKAFLPQSMLAAFNAANDSGDDEGDLVSISGTSDASALRSKSRSGAADEHLHETASQSTGVGAAETSSFVSDDSNGSGGPKTRKELKASDAIKRDRAKGIQQRRVTIAVFNLLGFSNIAVQDDVTIRRVQSAYLDIVSRNIRDNKGIIESFHGDRIVASFNAALPNASGGKRAASAALNIAHECQNVPGMPPLAIGISQSMARCGNMGTDSIQRYNIIGPVFKEAMAVERYATQRLRAVVDAKKADMPSVPYLICAGECMMDDLYLEFFYQVVDIVAMPRERSSIARHRSEVQYMHRSKSFSAAMLKSVSSVDEQPSPLLNPTRAMLDSSVNDSKRSPPTIHLPSAVEEVTPLVPIAKKETHYDEHTATRVPKVGGSAWRSAALQRTAPQMVISIERLKSMATDEWMYQIEEGEKADIYHTLNDAFASFLDSEHEQAAELLQKFRVAQEKKASQNLLNQNHTRSKMGGFLDGPLVDGGDALGEYMLMKERFVATPVICV